MKWRGWHVRKKLENHIQGVLCQQACANLPNEKGYFTCSLALCVGNLWLQTPTNKSTRLFGSLIQILHQSKRTAKKANISSTKSNPPKKNKGKELVISTNEKKRKRASYLFEHSLVNLVLSLIKYIQRTTTHTLSLSLYVGLDGGFFPSAKSINPHLTHKKITSTH